MLLVMAAGTGKTDTIALYLKRLFEAGLANRALFLVDRIDLGSNKEVFDEIIKTTHQTALWRQTARRIVNYYFNSPDSLLPTFTIHRGYFDVIISDEAHRSILEFITALAL